MFAELRSPQNLVVTVVAAVELETFTELHYSKTNAHLQSSKKSLKYLQNHTTLKQRLCFNFLVFGLRHLQNHTTLKRPTIPKWHNKSLRHLQNYTTLKPQIPNTSSAFQSLSSHHQV